VELRLKNIGMIKKATVKLDGLTVIAGENDTGKSTVGKVLFCAVKSSAMSSGGFFYRNRNKYIIKKLFGDLKNIIHLTQRQPNEYSRLAHRVNKIREDVEKILKLKCDKVSQRKHYLKKIQLLKDDSDISSLPLFEEVYKELEAAIEDSFKNKFTATNFENIMNFAFAGDYSYHLSDKSYSIVEIKDEIRNQSLRFELGSKLNFWGNKIFDDATFIDTPVIFQLIKLLNDTSLADKEYMPTIKDLKQKLIDLPQKRAIWEQQKIKEIIISIQETIGGDIVLEGSEFSYKKNDDPKPIKIENVATGIKSFGLLLFLLKKGYVHDKSILVFDEPEVHLHPKWELKMAEIIVKLVKYGTTIIVNSHSPYMIEALKRYSEVEAIEDKVNFYLAENGYIEHQDSLENIFEKLALPMRQLKQMKIDAYING
jgi:predicted ATPase